MTAVGRAGPALLAGLPVLPAAGAGLLPPVVAAGLAAAVAGALVVVERRPATACAAALAAWSTVVLLLGGRHALLALALLAPAVVAVAALAARAPHSAAQPAVLAGVPVMAAAVPLLTGPEVDQALAVGFGGALLAAVPWTLARYAARRADAVRAGWERAARAEAAARQARDQERTRLAAEMHDLVGHQLALAALRIGALEVDPAVHGPHRRAAGAARENVTAAADRLADAVRLLRGDPPAEPAVAELVDGARAAGLDARRSGGEGPDLDPVVATTLRRIVAEALTNAARHAAGAVVHVTVDDRGDGPRVVVTSGPGRSAGPPGSRTGLASLRERVAALGGDLTAGPRPDGGFTVTAELPRRPARPGHGPLAAEEARVHARTRRSGRRAATVALAIGVGGTLAALGYVWADAATSVLSPAAVTGIRVGTPEAAVAPLLPARPRSDDPDAVPPEPAGTACRYYSTSAEPLSDDLYRLCVRDGVVTGLDVVERTLTP